jgi:hypothetical protein
MKKCNPNTLINPISGMIQSEGLVDLLFCLQDQIDELEKAVEQQGHLLKRHEQTVRGLRVYR